LQDYIFDYRLGYVRSGCDIQGFDVIGDDDAPSGKIVTLGGYTTAEQAKAKTSWADGLYRSLCGGRRIYNGCTDGYTSAQELVMFIRDVILLEPKLVICLSGFNNIANKLGLVKHIQYGRHAEFLKTHPFATPRQMEFFYDITSRFGLGKNEVFYGEQTDMPAYEYWLRQMDMLNCLCAEFGIKLLVFVEPCVFSGGYRRSEAENEALTEIYGLTASELQNLGYGFQDEYKNLISGSKNRDFIIDLSGLFDSDSGVYLDAYHTKDEFTQKISDAVCEYIKKEACL